MRNQFYNLLPGIWCEVDTQSKFTYVNQEYCGLVGVNDPDFLLGKTVADLPCDAAQCAELFWKEDDKVKTTQEKQLFLNILRLAKNEWKIIKLIKTPVFEDGKLSSILFHITLPYDNMMQNFGIKMAQALEAQIPTISDGQSSLHITQRSMDNLSKKESECLFFLIFGKTYKEIAEIQAVAPRTIIDHIERLKFKLRCNTKSELISRAIELGYNYQIPASLLTNQLSIHL